MKKGIYHLEYTRDTGIIIQQLWAMGFETVYSKLFHCKPLVPLAIDHIVEGVIEIYLNRKLIKELNEEILRRNKKNSNFFVEALLKVKKQSIYIEDVLNKKNNITAGDLNDFINVVNIYVRDYIIYYHTIVNTKTPKSLLIIGKEFREKDEYWSRISTFIKDSLLRLYPNLRGFESMILKNEVIMPPNISILERRKKESVVLQNNKVVDHFSNTSFTFVSPKLNNKTYKFAGKIAHKGCVKGKVAVIKSISTAQSFKRGDVLVSPMTTPDMMNAISKCSAIITDEGGITCHAAIVARELKKPCIIGTKIATKVLKDGDLVEVDAEKGVVTILKRAGEK